MNEPLERFCVSFPFITFRHLYYQKNKILSGLAFSRRGPFITVLSLTVVAHISESHEADDYFEDMQYLTISSIPCQILKYSGQILKWLRGYFEGTIHPFYPEFVIKLDRKISAHFSTYPNNLKRVKDS